MPDVFRTQFFVPLLLDGNEVKDMDKDAVSVERRSLLARKRVLFELALWAILLAGSGLLIYFA